MEVSQAAAEHRRDTGISNGAAAADSAISGWSEAALERVINYAQTHESFLMEEVRADLGEEFPLPPDARAWGGVTRRAIKDGVIAKDGYAPARSSNLSPKQVWKSLVFPSPRPFSRLVSR